MWNDVGLDELESELELELQLEDEASDSYQCL